MGALASGLAQISGHLVKTFDVDESLELYRNLLTEAPPEEQLQIVLLLIKHLIEDDPKATKH